jgi:hypothetical protein
VKRLLPLLVLLAACHPDLYARSVPPPGAVGRLHTAHHWSEVTEGTVLAFTCVKYSSPCRSAHATSADPAIAEVLPASLAQLYLDYMGNAGVVQESTFVIVGKKPGTTHIRVQASQGHYDLKVTVLAADVPAVVAVPPDVAAR